MSKRTWASIGLAVAAVAVLVIATLMPPSAGHPVTDMMKAASGSAAGRTVTAERVESSDGRSYSPAVVAADRPLVLVFIMAGCPCSEAAEPYFQRLHAAYGSRAAFLGVIGGDAATAREWAVRHNSPYPVLADRDLKVVRDTDAKRSAYVALVAPGGTVETLWPGYSAAMLTELGSRLAALTGLPEVPIDVAGAPAKPTSGCPY